MATDISLSTGDTIKAAEIQIEYARASGPGGQHVNKTETKVTLRLNIAATSLPDQLKEKLTSRLTTRLTKAGDLLVSADKHRERQRNLEDATERLTDILEDALVEQKKRRPTRPSRGSKERRLKDKKRTADKKKGRGRVDREA